MLRRLGIRAKVLAVLAVPMLVVLLAGAFISIETLQNLRSEQNARDVATAVRAYVTVNGALNNERVASLTGAPADQLATARAATDAAVDEFRPVVARVDVASFSPGASILLDAMNRGFDEDLPKVRGDVDAGEPRVVGSTYASLVDGQLALFDRLAQELANRELATYLASAVAIGRTQDSLAQEHVDGLAQLTRAAPTIAAGQSYTTLTNQTEVYREAARSAVAALGVAGLELSDRDPSAVFNRMRGFIGSGSATTISAIPEESFANEVTLQRDALTSVETGVLDHADAVAAHAITAARQRAAITVGITALVAAGSLLLALFVSRAIVIPMRRLTAAAADLRDELPRLVEQVQVPGEGPQLTVPQIPVTSRDEVGRLAAAFNSVNSTTIRVAQEQAALRGSIAEMFVNVARRDQVLLNRQLSFIDSLERTEEDPQALANLFRLDHLATRMRRNAESLLVLAGIDSGRRLRDAIPLSDVVRTASSEIEQYDRIQLELGVDPHMLGFNALPAAHLLAELLENATVFSEPETPVVVSTAVAGPFVEVRIIDQGLGMSDVELAAANDKITATAASDALGAQRLGLFVVGRLAQRLGAEVSMRKSSRGTTGTETVVRFPATLFQSTEASPLGVYGVPSAADEPPMIPEVDLDALTDGLTDQGLPRRRTDAPSGPAHVRGSVVDVDEDAIVLPELRASALDPSLSGADSDWSPVVRSTQRADLPSRTPAQAPGWAEQTGAAERPAAPADPAARAGLFAGFRGRSELAAGPSDEAADLTDAPAESPFVVPGLVPDGPEGEAWEPATAWIAPAEREVLPAEPEVPAQPASWPSWAAAVNPDWAEAEAYVPAAFQPGQAPEPAIEDALPPAAEAAPTAEAEWAFDAVAPAFDAAAPEPWSPPEADPTQWPPIEQPAPEFDKGSGAFTGLSGWSLPAATTESAAFAPFERTLDEARAWATGAIPIVPDPAGLPGAAADDLTAPDGATAPPSGYDEPGADVGPEPVVDLEPEPVVDLGGEPADEPAAWSWPPPGLQVPALEPDEWALDGKDETTVLEPVPLDAEPAAFADEPEPVAAPVDEAPAELPGHVPEAPAWAPAPLPATPVGTFAEVAPEQPEAKRRRWFGRRKHDEVAPAPLAPPAAPSAAPSAAPVRSSAWAPAAPAPVAFEPPAPAPTPAAPAPAASAAWAPEASWSPPVTPPLPELHPASQAPASWSPPQWAPRPAATSEPDAGSSAPSSAPRIGTLDDGVAAMLALRSDIQEQALSELSQLSAYRPQVVHAADRLTRRVPAAVPQAPEIVESATAAERDPDELRSRLASFQSGTARGRRDAGRDEET